MLRQTNTRSLHWVDKTMSVLRADQLETCEKDLAGLPSHCLFEPECTDLDAEKLYKLSFFAEEDRVPPGQSSLHTVAELRNRVLHSFIQETALLSVDEHDLLIRAVLFGGRTRLTDWNELYPAQALVRRLWCRVDGSGENTTLFMPHQLCSSALLLLATDSHKAVRDIVEQVHEDIEDTLYLLGAAQASGPARHLSALLKGTGADGQPELIRRFLRTGYDYIYDRTGNLILIHPGLADPDKITELCALDMDQTALSQASGSVNALETPIYEHMLNLLMNLTRQEIDPEDAVNDLIILAKQDVPIKDMVEVLSAMLICQPTGEMRDALKDLSARVPRWQTLSSSQVQ